MPPSTVDGPAPRNPRWHQRLRVGHVAAGILFVAITALIGPALVGQGSFGGADHLVNFDPWRATADTGVDVTRAPVSDIVDARLPRQQQWGESVRAGDLALWNPFVVGGTGQHVDAFAPTELPYVALSAQRATAWVAYLGILVGALGCIGFLRRVGLSLLASVGGAAIYTFSGFQVAWVLWPQSHVGAVIPLVFWAVERQVQQPGARSVAAIAASSGWLLLEGFPAVAVVALAAAGGYGLVRVIVEHTTRASRLRVLSGAAAGAALGLAVAAVALVPLGALLQRAELPRDSLAGLNSDTAEALTLVSPDVFGGPDAAHRGPTNAIESASFVGVGAILLAATALVHRGAIAGRGVRAAFAIATVAIGLLVFVDGPHVDLAARLPVLDFNPLTRLRGLLGFSIAVGAAIGLETLRRPAGWDRRRLAGVAVVVVAAAAIVVRAVDRYPDVDGAIALRASLLRPALVGIIVLALIATTVWRPRLAAGATLLIAGVLMIDGASFASGWWRTTDDAAFYPATPTHTFLDDELNGDRFAGTGGSLVPGTGTYYGHREATGNAGHTPEWADLLRAADPGVFVTTTYTRLGPSAEVLTSPILDRLAVRFVSYPIGVVAGESTVPPTATSTIAFGAGPGVRAPWPGEATGAVVLPLVGDLISNDPMATIVVDVLDDDGSRVAGGVRRVFGGLPAGPVAVPVTTPDPDASPTTVVVRLVADDGTLVQVGADDAGTPALGAIRLPPSSRVVVADGATLVERMTALPRIRWASHAIGADDPAAAPSVLAAGIPSDTVLLAVDDVRTPDADATPELDPSPADVTIVTDGPEHIAVDVSADHGGYLVVADAIADWNATIDGEPVPLIDADHAMVAVFVDAGDHRIELSHDRGPFHVGATISLIALLLVGALAARGTERSTVLRAGLTVIGLAALAAIAVVSWRSIDPRPDDLSIPPLLVLALVVAFSYLVVSAEFHLAGRVLGVDIDTSTALMTTTIATAANMLPLPGAVLTRMVVLTRGGATAMASVRVLAAIGGLWLGVAMVVAGGGVAPNRPGIAIAMIATGILATAVGVALLRRFGADRSTIGWLLLTEASMTALGAVRLWLALRSLDIDGSVAEIVSVGVSAPLSAAVGIVPAGFGVREALAVVLGSLSGLGGAEAGVAAALDRAIGLAALAPAVLVATVIRRRRDEPAHHPTESTVS